MSLTPGYGETPVTDDELDALTPSARELLGVPVTKAAVYDRHRDPCSLAEFVRTRPIGE